MVRTTSVRLSKFIAGVCVTLIAGSAVPVVTAVSAAPAALAAPAVSPVLAAPAVPATPAVSAAPQTPPRLLGFSGPAAANEAGLEAAFDRQLDPQALREWMQRMASAPNHVGSAHDRENAEFIARQFKEWGWDTHIDTFELLYPTPLVQRLNMIEPRAYQATLHEPAVAGDRTSEEPARSALPPYAVYGADGDVTAPLVYVNFGMPEDYRELERRNISVRGRIVLARYGGGWRGIKPRLAREHGAVGCIIYSDPRDEGYFQGDTYPNGRWRPSDSVQRGSVLDATGYPDAPLREAHTAGTQGEFPGKRPGMAAIPVLPISASDAQPLLSALRGPVAPEAWRGALPLTYHLGPGLAKVHLTVRSQWATRTGYNVIAKIAGRDFPDEWVIRGNHHDGWVFGALDPLSGTVAMMAEAKAMGALLKTGWRPRRTVIFASWDAEEPGWLGSTAWAERNADALRQHAALYVNSDVNGRGFLVAGGSPSMQSLVNEVADNVRDPQTAGTVKQRLLAKLRVDAYESMNAAQAPTGADFPLAALGSGTDFTAFLDHLGITTLDLYYAGEDNNYGIWHSIYDSFDNYIRYGDPGFRYGITEAQTVGHVVLRAADADILPLRFEPLVKALKGYLQELRGLLDSARQRTAQRSELLAQNAFQLAADPVYPVAAPPPGSAVPQISFAALDDALARLQRDATTYDQTCDRAAADGALPDPRRLLQLNEILRRLEATLTSESGLPRRPWFHHLIFAPGYDTGYDAKTLPAVREAIENARWSEADAYIPITAKAIDRYSDLLEQATALLRP